MARITEVANELLFIILATGDGGLIVHDLASVARTCRALNDVATAVLYRHNVSHDRSSVMIWASQNNRLDTMKKALAFGADVNTFGPSDLDYGLDSTYGTPLHWAAKHGYDEIARLLLHHDAWLDAPSQRICHCPASGSAFHHVRRDHFSLNDFSLNNYHPRWYPLHLAICNRHETTAHIIMERHPPFYMRDEVPVSFGKGPTIIDCAAVSGLNTVVQRALTLYPSEFKMKKDQTLVRYTTSPLHYTVGCQGSKYVIKALVSAGCDLEAEDEDAMTPIWRACEVGNFATAIHLLAEGAQTRQAPRNTALYKSMLHYAVRGRAHWIRFSGIQDPNQVAFVNTLIEQHGYTVHDVGHEGQMPLNTALEPTGISYADASPMLIRCLLENGADPNCSGDNRMSPLFRVIQQLLDYTDNPLADISAGRNISDVPDGGWEDDALHGPQAGFRRDYSYTQLLNHGLDTALETPFWNVNRESTSQGPAQVKVREDTNSRYEIGFNPWLSEPLDPNLKSNESPMTKKLLRDAWEVMAELLRFGARLQARSNFQFSPIFLAVLSAAQDPARRYSYVLLKFLLENRRGGTYPSRSLNRLLLYCITLAPSYSGREAVTSLLIQHGASLHYEDSGLRRRLQCEFLRRDDVWLAKLCWEEGCLLSTPEQIFLEALRKGKREVARYILAVSDKSVITTVGERDATALHSATNQLDVEIARLLIEGGADVNALNYAGETPLCFVVDSFSKGSREVLLRMARLLLENHADPFITECGYSCIGTAKCFCQENQHHDFGCHDEMSAFDRALNHGLPSLVMCMLENSQLTRQHPCIICGYIRKLCTQRRPNYSFILGILLRAGANPNGCGLCPGDPFVTHCVKEIRESLLKAHSTENITRLLYLTKELVEAGATVDQPNSEGETAAGVLAEILAYGTTNEVGTCRLPIWKKINESLSVGFDDSGRASTIYILSCPPDEPGSRLFSDINWENHMCDSLKST
ncbi:hypothetical protein F5Y08DRAFT_338817 [Xylaria arbuscula]|nr:hypothetical protein F5Y08DRAFT_338817 [Xylaria arbuscula]